MIFKESKISGCFFIENSLFADQRGGFCKIFHDESFAENNINFKIKEVYYSESKKAVIRGMHFQTSPHEVAKIVACTNGEIIDVFLDIRPSSPTFGSYDSVILSAENAKSVYLPAGIAHGFQVLSDEADMLYLQDGLFSKECDSTIKWNSFGFAWPLEFPILSAKDNSALGFKEYFSLNKT